ncbi:amidohydrolase family protein [Microbacterium atlanticum]|uniref:amidohydrolase family protein n=1 Tax=Microbacterium atlanticum TaxID=2782168 RepID=UPI00188807D9|nr:amidohydrolase family protein [Microbacterium atlanticum]
MLHDDVFIADGLSLAIDYGGEAREQSELTQAMADKDLSVVEGLVPSEFLLERDRYQQAFSLEALIDTLFLESPVDITCFHSAELYGREYSPIGIGAELRRRHPDRTLLYGALTSEPDADARIAELERQVDEFGIVGLGVRPWDFIDGSPRELPLHDRELMYPVLERCGELGVTVIAVHKGLPEGLAPMDPYRPGDLDYAARDFPDLQFEVVHGGYGMLEETASQMDRYPNVWVNLEASMLYVMRRPGKFGRIVGALARAGGADRLLFGSGVPSAHPRPVIEAMWDFEMPAGLTRRGYPELSEQTKRGILGLNFARLHGIDVPERLSVIRDDDIAHIVRAEGLRAPWSHGRVPA